MGSGENGSLTLAMQIGYGHLWRIAVPRRFLRYLLLVVFLVMTFRTFQFFPGMSVFKELWLVAAFLFLSIPFLSWKARYGWRFSGFELYVLAMMGLVPVLSGIMAWREFGQPILYGVLAQRNMILGAGALALVYGFRQRLFTLRDVEKALLLLAWNTLLAYIAMNILSDPTQFMDYHSSFVSGGNVGEASFKFNTLFITFGFYYYAFIGFRRKSGRHYLMAGVFFAYLVVGEGGRSLIVSLLAAFAFFAYRWGSAARLLLFGPRMAAAGVVLVSLLYMMNGDYMVHLLTRFFDAFSVVLAGETTGDVSANARLIETAIALPYIMKHWLLGNGDISNQWRGGYEGVLGGYFFPSDIGIIGVVYMYGLLGLVLFSAQFLFALRFARRMPQGIVSLPMIDAIKGFLLYFAIHSLMTGRCVHYSETSFLFVALLGYIATEMRGWAASAQAGAESTG